MEKNGDMTMKDVLGSMIASYAERDKKVVFSDWLAERLQQEMPEIEPEAGRKLADEIIAAVADYDGRLQELNHAIEAGTSKEEWLAERLSETYADMPLESSGEKLQDIETDFTLSNMQLFDEIGTAGSLEDNSVDTESVEWNRYSVKNKAYEIGKHAALIGVAAAAKAIENIEQNDGNGNYGAAFREAFQNNLKGEVKAVVAGAVRVAAEKGIGEVLPDTPVERICDMAGVAVEGAEAIFDAANGDITVTEAVDKIGRAGVAAGCRVAQQALQGVILRIPYVGILLTDLLRGLFEHMESSQFYDNVYVVVRDAAKATWKGIKEAIGEKVDAILKLKAALIQ